MVRLVVNRGPSPRRQFGARFGRAVRFVISRGIKAFHSAWNQAFPMPPLNDPDPTTTPPIAKAAVLREGALLSEKIEAKSDRRVA
jgi:hypothetical protein